MKRIETQVDLPAVPPVVWEQLVDAAAMGAWNPFTTSRPRRRAADLVDTLTAVGMIFGALGGLGLAC